MRLVYTMTCLIIIVLVLFTRCNTLLYGNTINNYWNENLTETVNFIVKQYFKTTFCLQLIYDNFIQIDHIPVYLHSKFINCKNILIMFENVKLVRSILKDKKMPKEAKYIIITVIAENNQNYLSPTIEEEFYIDIRLIEVFNNIVKNDKQLGYVIGENGRVDLRGRKLLAVGMRNPPFAVYQPEKKIKLNGVEIRVIRELGYNMNFTWRIREPSDKHGAGHRNDTGHWNGLRGDLARGSADLGIAVLYLNFDNYISFQLTSPYTFVCLTFLVPAPGNILGHWNALLKPLRLETWLCFFFLSFLYIIAYKLITQKSYVTSCMETIRVAALLSSPYTYTNLSQRLIFLSWILGSFFVAGLYSSELSSWMVAQITRAPIRSLQDFAHSNLQWVQEDSYMLDLLDNSYSPIAKDILHKYYHAENKLEIEKLILTGKFATVVNVLSDGYPSGAEFLSPEARKILIALQECFVSHYASIGMRPGLPLHKASSLEIRRLQEAGLFQQWQAEDVKTYGDGADYKNLKSKTTQVSPLNAENFGGAIAFWIIGTFLALLVFICEKMPLRLKITCKT